MFAVLNSFNSNGQSYCPTTNVGRAFFSSVSKIYEVFAPCVCCNGIYVPFDMRIKQRVASTFFYLIKCLIIMSNSKTKQGISTMGIQAMHAVHRPELAQRLMHKSFHELVNDFFIEMDCKNEAYFFILENGYFDEFKEYSKTNKNVE